MGGRRRGRLIFFFFEWVDKGPAAAGEEDSESEGEGEED